nr:hypothetical protein CFP56_40262 [Quercus suber]
MVLEPTALYANNSSNAKGYQGQTYHGGNQQVHQDKFYKRHGYPPGYKPKGKSSANQVSSAGNFGNFSPNLGSFGNFASQPLSGFPNQAEMMNCSPQMIGYSPQHSGTQPQSQFNVPQCPITQSQCEQLLSFLASQSLKEASNHQVAPAHQAASVLSPLANVAASSSASLPPHFINNFSGEPKQVGWAFSFTASEFSCLFHETRTHGPNASPSSDAG